MCSGNEPANADNELESPVTELHGPRHLTGMHHLVLTMAIPERRLRPGPTAPSAPWEEIGHLPGPGHLLQVLAPASGPPSWRAMEGRREAKRGAPGCIPRSTCSPQWDQPRPRQGDQKHMIIGRGSLSGDRQPSWNGRGERGSTKRGGAGLAAGSMMSFIKYNCTRPRASRECVRWSCTLALQAPGPCSQCSFVSGDGVMAVLDRTPACGNINS